MNKNKSPDLQDLEILFDKVRDINLESFIHETEGDSFEYNENMLKITTDGMNSPRIYFVDTDLKIKVYGCLKDIVNLGRYDDVKFALEEFILKHV